MWKKVMPFNFSILLLFLLIFFIFFSNFFTIFSVSIGPHVGLYTPKSKNFWKKYLWHFIKFNLSSLRHSVAQGKLTVRSLCNIHKVLGAVWNFFLWECKCKNVKLLRDVAVIFWNINFAIKYQIDMVQNCGAHLTVKSQSLWYQYEILILPLQQDYECWKNVNWRILRWWNLYKQKLHKKIPTIKMKSKSWVIPELWKEMFKQWLRKVSTLLF